MSASGAYGVREEILESWGAALGWLSLGPNGNCAVLRRAGKSHLLPPAVPVQVSDTAAAGTVPEELLADGDRALGGARASGGVWVAALGWLSLASNGKAALGGTGE